MDAFPAEPISPSEFFEGFVPAAFARSGALESASDLDIQLGVRLEGEGGGEWLLRVDRGALTVAPGSRREASLSVVQSVADWRGTFWEGRGGIVGRQAFAFLRPDERERVEGSAPIGLPTLDSIAPLADLDGLLRVVVRDAAAGDWSVALRLGPGEIPEEPTATVLVDAEDTAAMERGELDPMQAFMAGRIEIAGDVGLVMQLAALQMKPRS